MRCRPTYLPSLENTQGAVYCNAGNFFMQYFASDLVKMIIKYMDLTSILIRRSETVFAQSSACTMRLREKGFFPY